MKRIKNTGYQSINLCLTTLKGPKFIWLKPKDSIVVQEKMISNQVKNLSSRKRIKVASI